MKSILSMYCAIIVVLVISGVPLVPASAMANEPLIPDLGSTLNTEIPVPGLEGATVKKLPGPSDDGTSASSMTTNPVFDLTVKKMQIKGMEPTRTETGRYEFKIPDATLDKLNVENAKLSADLGPELTELQAEMQNENRDEFARLQEMSAAAQKSARHENGKTITLVEFIGMTFTNQQTGETRDVGVMQSLDAAGNPTGATQVMSDSGNIPASSGILGSQSAVPPEQEELFKQYSSACIITEIAFWTVYAIMVVLTFVALALFILMIIIMSGALAPIDAFVIGVAWNWFFLILFGLLTMSGGYTLWYMMALYVSMKAACTQREEYRAESRIEEYLRPNWNLLDNHRAIAWQDYSGTSTAYTSVRPMADGGSLAAGYKVLGKKKIVGTITKFDVAGTVLKTIEINEKENTYISDLQVLPDGTAYVFGLATSEPVSLDQKSASDAEGFVNKYDSEGTLLWSRSMTGTGLSSGVIAADGTVYAAGIQVIDEKHINGLIAVFNPDGTDHPVDAWSTYLEPVKSMSTFKYSETSDINQITDILLTQDNGVIMGGSAVPDYTQEVRKGWLLKLNADGRQEWSVTSQSEKNTGYNGVLQTPGGNYITVGSSAKIDKDGGLFAPHDEKLGSSGIVTTWSTAGEEIRTVEFTNLMMVDLLDIRLTADGGYLISGFGRINGGPVAGVHGKMDGWVAKLRPDLSLEWQKAMGGSEDDVFSGAFEASNGEVVAFGITTSHDFDLSGRTDKDNKKAVAWIVDLRFDPAKEPDKMDVYCLA